jgi:hypothetical protein
MLKKRDKPWKISRYVSLSSTHCRTGGNYEIKIIHILKKKAIKIHLIKDKKRTNTLFLAQTVVYHM